MGLSGRGCSPETPKTGLGFIGHQREGTEHAKAPLKALIWAAPCPHQHMGVPPPGMVPQQPPAAAAPAAECATCGALRARLGCKKHLKQTNTKKTFAFITPVFFPGRMFFTTQGSPATKHNGSQLVLFSFVFFSLRGMATK